MSFGDFRDVTEADRQDADCEAHRRCVVCDVRGCIESLCPVYGCCGSESALIVVNGEPVCAIDCADILAQPSVAEMTASLAGAKPCR